MTMVKAFTLLEVMLAVAVIGAIGLISTPVYQSAYGRANLRAVTTHTAQAARRAQALAQAVTSDSQWGISIQTGTITLFRGASFATRVTADDETYSFPPTVVPSGVSEIVYAKMTGIPTTTGTITFTSDSGEIKTVTINAQGTVTY